MAEHGGDSLRCGGTSHGGTAKAAEEKSKKFTTLHDTLRIRRIIAAYGVVSIGTPLGSGEFRTMAHSNWDRKA